MGKGGRKVRALWVEQGAGDEGPWMKRPKTVTVKT